MTPIMDMDGAFRVLEVMGEVTELGRGNVRVPVKPSREYLHHVGVEVPAGAFLGVVDNIKRDTNYGFTGTEEGGVIEHNTFAEGQVGEEVSEPQQVEPPMEGIFGGIKFKVTSVA